MDKLMNTVQIICSSELLSVVAILMSAFFAYYFSKRRYTFEKSHDRRLLILEEMYGKMISLRQEIKSYLWFSAESHDKSTDEKNKILQEVNNGFFELQRLFWEKEIVLNAEVATKIQKLLDKYTEVYSGSTRAIIEAKLSREQANSVSLYLENLDKLKDFEDILNGLKKEFRNIITR